MATVSTGPNAPPNATFVTQASDATLTAERVLTGTSNQIILTDGGANSTLTLTTPQNIHTAATPTFASLTLSGLTSGRATFATTSGLLTDDADFTFNGSQLALAVQGTAGGVLIGGDTQLYRRTTNVLALDSTDSFEVPTNFAVGTTITSTTSVKLNAAQSGITTGMDITGTATAGYTGLNSAPTMNSATVSDRVWALRFSPTASGTTAYTDTNGVAVGFEGLAIYSGSTSAGAATGAILYVRNSGTGTLTRATGLRIVTNENTGGGILTNSRAIDVAGTGPAIAANGQTRIGLRFAGDQDPGGFTGTISTFIHFNVDTFAKRNGMHWGTSVTAVSNLYLGASGILYTDGALNFTAAGLVSAPAITFADADTGLYSPAVGQLAFAINGSQTLNMAAADQWGWHGTAVSAGNYHTATVNTSTRSQFMAVDMTRTGIGGATIIILKFTARPQNDVGTNVGSFTTVVERNNPNRGFTAVFGDCGLGAATTMASGTSTFYGVNFVPTAATSGNVTGGTLTFTGFRFATIPANYAGGGATTYFRGSYFGDNLGSAYGNSEVAPDLLISSDGTNGVVDYTGGLVFNELGASVDLRIEGDTDANLLFLDASADTVQIGAATTSDSAKFYVAGKISTSSEMEINGALNHDGTNVGFYGAAPATQQTITGSRSGNAALADLLTKLALSGIIIDGTSA